MRRLLAAERLFVVGHLLSMAFGLAGLILVLPNAELIANLPAIGQTLFQWSMAGGGVAYMLLGTAAIAAYAYRTVGLRHWLSFMVPAVFISLGSELLGTSTGFPFGDYRYLSGLGYKILERVPFTIPLSWFYVGFTTYVLVRAGIDRRSVPGWVRSLGAIAFGSLLLTCWDLVLDPAMSQTDIPFWVWDQPGAFFGMPYQNFAGWFVTGVLFMSVATLLWKKAPLALSRAQLNVALIVYLGNILFGATLSIAAGIWVPVLLAIAFALIPALIFYWLTPATQPTQPLTAASEMSEDSQPLNPHQTSQAPVASLRVMPK